VNYEKIALWSQVVSSVLFAVIVLRLFTTYLLPAIARAQARKNREIEQAERERDEARADVRRAEAEVVSARADAERIAVDAKMYAQRERDRIVRESQESAALAVRNAEGELARSRAGASAEVRTRLVARALEIARASARGTIDEATDARLIAGVAPASTNGGSRA